MPGPFDPVNNPMGALQQMAQERAQQQSNYRTQQQSSYAEQMQQLRNAIAQENARENSYAWGDVAAGAASVEPRVGNLGRMLANTGAIVSKGREGRAQTNIKNLSDVAKMQSADLRALEQNDLLKAAYGGRGGAIGFEFRRNADGTTTVYNKMTGQPMATYGPRAVSDLNRLTDTLVKKYIDTGEYKNMEEATTAAQAEALRIFSQNAEAGGAGVTGPTPPQGGTTGPTTFRGGVPPARPASDAAAPERKQNIQLRMQAPNGEVSSTEGLELPSEAQEEVARLIARLEANPNEELHMRTVARLNQIAEEYGSRVGLPKKDEIRKEFNKEAAKTTAKALAEEFTDLQGAAAASSQMLGQLDLLKQLYQTPNMPEGEQGERIQSIRSSLKSIGIDTGDATDAANLASSIAGKMALLTRTADGKNLMPGAMSDFENKILRGLVPGLQGTAEGRAALIDVLSAMANSRIRMAKDASNYMDDNGVVSPEWNKRKLRLAKEEMARMAVINRQIAERFKLPGAQ